ncbi:MAG: NAD(+) synthase, partial [Lachnospiraceae bacterium]|nr:NAD(+) synthase [Lachnospiraceae bacterium]
MNYGFVNTAAVTPKIKVADVAHNGAEIEKLMREASKYAKIIVFPELCLTGATCGDVFKQELLLLSAKEELLRLVEVSKEVKGLMIVGLPWEVRTKLYNVAAVFEDGQLLGIVPKTYMKDAGNFTAGKPGYEYVDVNGEMIPFGTSLLFT